MKFCANISFMFTAESKNRIERYALAEAAGFEAVESGFPFGNTVSEMKRAKEISGLQHVMMNMKTGDLKKGEWGVTAIPGMESKFKQLLAETIEYAIALDVKKVHILAGKVETVSEKHWETYESNLKYAVEELAKVNIMGLIQPINHHSMPHYFLSDFEKAVEIIKTINSPYLRLTLDIFHLQHIRGDISYNIIHLMPYVGHVQIAQVPNHNEPDAPGEINYAYVLKLLKDCGYTDWVGLEYKPQGSTTKGMKWIQNFGYSL